MDKAHRMLGKTLVARSVTAILTFAATAALADGIMPKTYRERERHHFRDVQRGVGHPADTPTQQVVRPNTPFVFPWDFLFAPPKSPASPTPTAPTK